MVRCGDLDFFQVQKTKTKKDHSIKQKTDNTIYLILFIAQLHPIQHQMSAFWVIYWKMKWGKLKFNEDKF